MPKAKGSAKSSKAAAKRKAVQDSSEDNDWSKLSVAQLKEECKNKGLSTLGKKDHLIQRLEESDAEGPVPKLVRQSSEGTKKVKAALDAIVKSAPKKRTAKPDSHCPLNGNIAVFEDFDCMLNQTNISQNNNKFYVIQLLEDTKAKKFYLWTRWGRVGEPGANELKGPFNKNEEAENLFKKKFKDKTKNDWDKRDNFKPFSGKYTLIDMGDDDEIDEVDLSKRTLIVKKEANEDTLECSLDEDTQYLISLIFDDKTFVDAMEKLQLDVKKMPLGALSQSQIAKGFDALVDIENAIKNNRPYHELETLSSNFYTLIPHSFGRQRPPVISDLDVVRVKKDMLIVLSDIEVAQSMQKEKKKQKDTKQLKPHPLDEKYELLKCKLNVINKNSQEYKLIETYVKNTGNVRLKKVWRVERSSEETRFKEFDSVDNRRLLWHGTNVAVVAAILKEGLRIMPHSGGRVGRGLYFASENSKSSAYVGFASNGDGIMFLNEVVLGKEHHITRDDPSLTAAPKGFHSVIAKGQTEPDPKQDTVLTLDNKKVAVPQGKPITIYKSYNDTNFSQSEYLIYKENQVRIRYLILISWN